MSVYRIQTARIRPQAAALRSCGSEVKGISGEVRSVCRNLSLDGSYREILRQKLNAIADEISSCGESSVQMGDALTGILEQYLSADRQSGSVADGKEDNPGDGHTDRSGMTADLRRMSEEIRRLVDRCVCV